MTTIKKLIKNSILHLKIHYYNINKEKKINKVFSKATINVVFFVLYDSMWKCDGLFRLLQESKRFKPYIISSPYPNHPRKFSIENQKRVRQFFTQKGFTYIDGYDFSSNKLFDIKSLQPDIIFYQQPYNAGYKGFKIEALWDSCIFGYIPYCFDLEKGEAFYNNLLQNIAWKVFLPTEYEKECESKILYNKGKNLVATGYPMAEELMSPPDSNAYSVWKIPRKEIKKIIWAPHHSILPNDALNYSNFLSIADDMLLLAKKYKNLVQFAFKPHPVLKRKLYRIPEWGQERTDRYYSEWANSPNTIISEGSYIDLFKSSDAMIHDSASFTIEYLYTSKPVMYLAKSDHTDFLNDFGIKCFNMHYHGSSIEDVVEFIDNVVLQKEDPLFEKRNNFLCNELLAKNGKSIAQNMFDEFSSELQ